MSEALANRVYNNAVAAGRLGATRSNEFNGGALACLEGRLAGKMPLVCPHEAGTIEHAEFFAGVAEGRELSPSWGLPFGETEGTEHD